MSRVVTTKALIISTPKNSPMGAVSPGSASTSVPNPVAKARMGPPPGPMRCCSEPAAGEAAASSPSSWPAM